MGQRHQIFLIARVIPNGEEKAKYRCIAAVHHQWLYGTLPLRAANRFIRLARQPQNAMIIREEIKTLHGKYGRRGEKPKLPEIPALYSMYLLESALCTDMAAEDPVVSGICQEDANMGSLEGDNNDGITVIDVTDPEDPHYCFIQFNNLRVLSAHGYARGYYPHPSPPESYDRHADIPQTPPEGCDETVTDPAFSQQIEDCISQFSDVKLIEPHMLAEAWPDEYGGEVDDEVDDRVDEESSKAPSLDLDKDAKKQSAPLVSSLVQISLKPAIISATEADQLHVLDHYLSDPVVRNALKQMIMEDSALQSKSVPLLSAVVARELESDPTTTIDLSDLTLTSEQIIDILTSHQNISSLNLSRNLNVTAKTLEILLTKLANLRRLILFDTGITRDELVALLKSQPSLFYRLSVLIHPALLTLDDTELAWASDYGHWNYDANSYSIDVTLPFFSPAQVVQAIVSLFAAARRAKEYSKIINCSPFLNAAYSAEYREEQKRPWSDRLVPICPPNNRHASFSRLHGWLFIWSKPYPTFYGRYSKDIDWNQTANNLYAWIRFNSKTIEDCEAIREIEDPVQKALAAVEILGEQIFEVYDLQGFLDACAAEGRPSIPEDLRKTAFECLEKWKTVDPNAATPETFRPIVSASDVLALFKTQSPKSKS